VLAYLKENMADFLLLQKAWNHICTQRTQFIRRKLLSCALVLPLSPNMSEEGSFYCNSRTV